MLNCAKTNIPTLKPPLPCQQSSPHVPVESLSSSAGPELGRGVGDAHLGPSSLQWGWLP